MTNPILGGAVPPEVLEVQSAEPVLTVNATDRRRPIVIKVKKGKKKRRYSKSLKDLQIGLRSGTRVSERLADAIAAGLDKYKRKSDRSSRRKRDGMLKDALRNSASGAQIMLRKSSRLPVLLAKGVRRKTVVRRLRAIRRLSRLFMR
jgi:hypothetical protein